MATTLFAPQQELGITNVLIEGFKSNIEIFPDLFLSTICLYAIILQYPPFIALAISLLSVQVVQPLLGSIFREILPNTWAAPARREATGLFPGVSPERLSFNQTAAPGVGIPSYYTMFLGTLLGWIGPIFYLYPKELSMSPQRAFAYYISFGFATFLAVNGILYRWLASQDTILGIVLGVGFGGILGASLVWLLSIFTQRRATNLYNFPLITTMYGTTKPIYVCNKT